MKKLYVAILVLFSICFTESVTYAQELNAGADIMSRYIWRGRDYGNSASIQPTLEFSAGGFTVGTWGAFSINADVYQEHDIYVSYSFLDMFSVGVTDYFFPVFNIADPTLSNSYFDFADETTGHYVEANFGFDGTESFPISISANVFFYGADKKAEDEPEDPDNPEMVNAYSTYIELGYANKVGDVDYNVFLGITPNETSLYSDKAGIVNLGITATKSVQITDKYALPVSSSFIINPNQENIYFVFGISL